MHLRGADAVGEVGTLQRWDPVDSAFAGCQSACGAHVEGDQPDIVAQPGASIGQRTYCPVSGAVFEVEADHPHADVDGQTLWFCCAGCAAYFEAHRDEVLELRGIGLCRHRRSLRPFPPASPRTTRPPSLARRAHPSGRP